MKPFTIDISYIEELQTLKDVHELDKLFSRAQSTIVNGEKVTLIRKTSFAPLEKFDEISTLEELNTFRQSVYKYLE